MKYFLFWIAFFGLAIATTACRNIQHVAFKESTYLDATPLAHPDEDQEIEVFIAPYREQLNAEMNQVIGNAGATMIKDAPHNPLGNWMCDALSSHFQRLGFEFDLVVTNPGGIRIPAVEAGPIYKSTIFELMPFDNYMVILELNGAVLQQLFDHTLSFGGWPVGEGVYYSHSGSGSTEVVINGQPIDAEARYRMLVSDYIANGGDRAFFLQDISQEETGVLMRDAIIEYVKFQHVEGVEITAPLEKRVEFQ